MVTRITGESVSTQPASLYKIGNKIIIYYLGVQNIYYLGVRQNICTGFYEYVCTRECHNRSRHRVAACQAETAVLWDGHNRSRHRGAACQAETAVLWDGHFDIECVAQSCVGGCL